MPSRNRAHLVPRAIASVRAQTMPAWELVCVDDGSTDDTAAVVGAIADPRVRLLRQATSGGASHARNVGIRAAAAPWIAFLDDDNEWEPAMLERLLERGGDPETAMVYCLTSRRDDATGRVAAPWRRLPEGDMFLHLLEGWNPMISAVVIRRPALLALGGFDERLAAFEDLDLLLRLAASGARVLGVGAPLLIRHEHHAAGAISDDVSRLRRALADVTARWREPIETRVGARAFLRWRARLASRVEFVAVRNAAARGDRWLAWRRFMAFLPLVPRSRRHALQALILALLGSRGYDAVARLRDVALRGLGGPGNHGAAAPPGGSGRRG
jgi:glycosyltransferase involved in cell wall biosynthesis